MKKIISFVSAVLAAFFLAVSCSSVKSLSSSSDYTAGSTAAVALARLASNYIASGTVDLGNVQNILNLSSLASTLGSLTSGSMAAVKDYSAGLVAGSSLFTSDNVGSVVSALTDLANLDANKIVGGIQQGAAVSADKVEGVKSQLENVLKIFSK